MIYEKQLLAMDLGNGYTSIATADGNIEEFPSLMMKYSDGIMGDVKKENILDSSFGKYIVGEPCRVEGVKTRSTDTSYYFSDQYRAVFVYALKKANIKNSVLVTGLPTEFWAQLKKEFAEKLKVWARDEGLQIDRVIVLPQHAGPAYDPKLLDEKGDTVSHQNIMKGKVGVIDIGQGTTDCGEFNDGKPSENRHHGENKGVSDLHKNLLTLLQSPPESLKIQGKLKKGYLPSDFSLPGDINEYDIDRWLREDGNLPFRGKNIDLHTLAIPVKTQFVESVIKRCIQVLWTNTDFHKAIIVSGGGAALLGKNILKDVIKCPIYIPETPNLSTVRGYMEFLIHWSSNR